MKNLLRIFILIMLIFAFVIGAHSETNAPKKVLLKGDVERFIKTFPLMYKDMERLGVEYETDDGNVTVPKALKANKEFLGILKKHGWDEQFVEKMRVILVGFYILVYQDEMAKSKIQVQESIAEIEADPDLSPANKKKLIDQLKQTESSLEKGTSEQKKSIHDADLELVRPHVKDLEAMFEQLDEEAGDTDVGEEYEEYENYDYEE